MQVQLKTIQSERERHWLYCTLILLHCIRACVSCTVRATPPSPPSPEHIVEGHVSTAVQSLHLVAHVLEQQLVFVQIHLQAASEQPEQELHPGRGDHALGRHGGRRGQRVIQSKIWWHLDLTLKNQTWCHSSIYADESAVILQILEAFSTVFEWYFMITSSVFHHLITTWHQKHRLTHPLQIPSQNPPTAANIIFYTSLLLLFKLSDWFLILNVCV